MLHLDWKWLLPMLLPAISGCDRPVLKALPYGLVAGYGDVREATAPPRNRCNGLSVDTAGVSFRATPDATVVMAGVVSAEVARNPVVPEVGCAR